MDFYVFQDNNWAAVLATGEYYASSGAKKNIVIYDGIEPASDRDTTKLMLYQDQTNRRASDSY